MPVPLKTFTAKNAEPAEIFGENLFRTVISFCVCQKFRMFIIRIMRIEIKKACPLKKKVKKKVLTQRHKGAETLRFCNTDYLLC